MEEDGLTFLAHACDHIGRLGESEVNVLVVLCRCGVDEPNADAILSADRLRYLPATDPAQRYDGVDVRRESFKSADAAEVDAPIMWMSDAGIDRSPVRVVAVVG
jgi:hypothetical protein